MFILKIWLQIIFWQQDTTYVCPYAYGLYQVSAKEGLGLEFITSMSISFKDNWRQENITISTRQESTSDWQRNPSQLGKAMQWGPKHDWPGGWHTGECWVNKNVCFSGSCLNTSILIIEIDHTRYMGQLGRLSRPNLYFGGWTFGANIKSMKSRRNTKCAHNVA